ncbi:hypothetical protein GcM3_020016 [Golovinomyces cichoracearum]|uniref:Helix-turn-helix domain-containing protein n=1 Tax=Golovinomyces cichoracearum TaxID=62708 RepID=A0A420J7N2_9PEZI|nr:hypothetical protein GcM3_020016 [Golovinomyces cichoracearum]
MGSTNSKYIQRGPIANLVKKSGDSSRIRSFPKRSSNPFMNPSPSKVATHESPVKSENTGQYGSDFTSTQQNTNQDDMDKSLNKRLQQIGPVQPPIVLAIPPSPHLRSSNPPISGNSSSELSEQVSLTSPAVGRPRSEVMFKTPVSNAAISLLKARDRYSEEAEAELANLGKKGQKGRRYLDIDMLRQVLIMRQANGGLADEEIESRLGLHVGVVSLLGKIGVVGVVE